MEREGCNENQVRVEGERGQRKTWQGENKQALPFGLGLASSDATECPVLTPCWSKLAEFSGRGRYGGAQKAGRSFLLCREIPSQKWEPGIMTV